ncbi:hypothetical protein [Streptomyces mutabilis]|uniref:hypothetical protein n=1 Tax=Streptomyces mutabilis TaxID=67332 RepID=UPI00369DB562
MQLDAPVPRDPQVTDRPPTADHRPPTTEACSPMPVDLQTGVRTYQFVVDRLEERRGEQYPAGRDKYEADWTAAHDLEKTFAEAVNANDLATAESLLQEITKFGRTVAGPP